eukprot:SAG11_NODE_5712_length_1481_cov_1.559334_1_plen_307_part_00
MKAFSFATILVLGGGACAIMAAAVTADESTSVGMGAFCLLFPGGPGACAVLPTDTGFHSELYMLQTDVLAMANRTGGVATAAAPGSPRHCGQWVAVNLGRGFSPHSAISVINGGSVALARLALPIAVLTMALVGLSGPSSRLALEAVTIPEHLDWGTLGPGMVTSRAREQLNVHSPLDFLMGSFAVQSGPCTVTNGGQCVWLWPGGYLPNEHCEILVTNAGLLGVCPVFDIYANSGDSLTLPTSNHCDSFTTCNCPIATVLTLGQTVTLNSDISWQGRQPEQLDSAKAGLPQSWDGAGGGWQVCFA